jgi:nitrogen-specific signal transduction histidine kinase
MKLERAETIVEITHQIAHELRNPMTIIGGYARSALKKTSARDANYKNLQIIVSEIERMENLLDNFIDHISICENKAQELSLNSVVEHNLELLGPELERKKLLLAKKLQPDLPSLYLNPEVLSSSLFNLLRYILFNSVPGGSLEIVTRLEKDETVLRLSLSHPDLISEKPRNPNLALLSPLIQRLGGMIRYCTKDRVSFCLEIRFPIKGGKDGKHSDSG